AGSRDSDPHALRVAWIKNNCVQTHATCTRLPLRPGSVPTQSGELLPVLAAIARPEDGSVFNACINSVGIGQRWLQMPHPLELPGVLRPGIPLMRGERRSGRVVCELVARRFRRPGFWLLTCRRPRLMPRLTAIIRALNDLPKPAAGLRGIDAVGISRRTFQVVHIPA